MLLTSTLLTSITLQAYKREEGKLSLGIDGDLVGWQSIVESDGLDKHGTCVTIVEHCQPTMCYFV
jgi:hypothetical protein